MRTTKTGIAVFLCLLVGHVAQIASPVYACLAAIVTMQDTPAKTVQSGKTRLIGTAVGAMIGIAGIWVVTLYSNPLIRMVTITLFVIFGLVICYVIKQKEACAICAVVITVTLIGHTTEDMVVYSFSRAWETALGVIIAIPVNRFLWPKSEEEGDKAVENESIG